MPKGCSKDKKTGQRFGCITVVSKSFPPDGQYSQQARWWLIKCDCGHRKVVYSNELVGRKWISCGHDCKFPRINELPFGESEKRAQYSKTKDEAIKNGYIFELTIDQFHLVVSEPCAYCGVANSKKLGLNRNKKHPNRHVYKCNGIDRIDSSKGYVDGNCASACKYCNWAKNSQTVDQFKDHITKIYNHFVLGKANALSA